MKDRNMKTLQLAALFVSVTLSLRAADSPGVTPVPIPVPKDPPPPIMVRIAPTPAAPAPAPAPASPPRQVYVYDQWLMPGRGPLLRPEQAQAIIDRFKPAYQKMGSPRLVIYVNRDLVAGDAKDSALADKQTVRDVERLFGRPLRMGGASLSDQRI